ncbi:MAG: hypothetical protein ACE5HF_04185 [Gemmatimonadota bacterium]
MTGGPESQGGRVAEFRAARRRDARRIFRLGLLASLIVHLLVVLIVARELHVRASRFRPTAVAPPPPPEGLRVVNLPEIEVRVTTPLVVERPLEEPRPERPPVVSAPGPPPEVVGPGEGLTNAEKLRPREGDPRLWKEFRDRRTARGPVTFAEVERLLREKLAAMLDSLSAEQRAAAVEWLVGKGDKKWGITPDGIVLGGVTIPINLGALFQEEGPNGRESRRKARDLTDIRRQDLLQDAEAVRRERLEEMRKRTEEEVERRRQDTAQAPQPADTAAVVSSP